MASGGRRTQVIRAVTQEQSTTHTGCMQGCRIRQFWPRIVCVCVCIRVCDVYCILGGLRASMVQNPKPLTFSHKTPQISPDFVPCMPDAHQHSDDGLLWWNISISPRFAGAAHVSPLPYACAYFLAWPYAYTYAFAYAYDVCVSCNSGCMPQLHPMHHYTQ